MTPVTSPMVAKLDRAECVRLLTSETVGRLGFVHEGSPEVLPVNYVMDGDAVVFATNTGMKLWDATRSPVVFEVDCVDSSSRSGWSVVVHGLAQEVTTADAPVLTERLAALHLRPWVEGDRPHLVRIAPTAITGRKVGQGLPSEEVPSARGNLTELTRDECFELLRTQPVGRLAVVDDDGPPFVVPVNYLVSGEAIVFRSDAGLKVRLVRRRPVSFQADFIDQFHHTGWSVLAHGIGYEASHWETDHLSLEPWAEGHKGQWIRIAVEGITGRRLTAADMDWHTSDRGYL